MNDDRWVVDTIEMTDEYKTDFDMVFRKFTLLNWSNVPFYKDDRENMRDFIIELVHEIEALQTENISTEHARLVLWNELKARNKIFVDTIKENSQLRAKVIDLADRLAELGPANPHEDDDE